MARRNKRRDKDKEIPEQKPVGGLAFFTTLVLAAVFCGIAPLALIRIWVPESAPRVAYFLGASLVSYFIASLIVRHHFAVLIHEFKHALVSSFSGNKSKGMKIDRESGHFQYEYTKATAASNAFISVAPYWLPIFTVPTLGLVQLFFKASPIMMLLLTGLAYGADCSFNWRDISPIQTDLTMIRGGYRIGWLFVLLINLALFFFLLPWIFVGPTGWQMFFNSLVELVGPKVL